MEFMKSLGKGSYGSVDLMRLTKPNGSEPSYHAVKSSYAHDHESLRKEFRILNELRNCPKIVQTLGSSLWRGVDDNGVRVYKMSMEYAAGGSLASFMETRTSLSDSMIRDFTVMILQGLVSVHSHGYVHCDIKPENLLVFPRHENDKASGLRSTYELKLSDFGMSTKAGEESEFWEFDTPFLGTPLYMSPESVQGGVAERALDLWSLGCVVLEMYTGEPPWPYADSEDLMPELLNGRAPEIPQSLPCDARKFLKTCFARKPDERGSAEELLKHQFLMKASESKKVVVTGAGGERQPVVNVLRSKDNTKKPPRVPPKPLQFKRSSHRPLRLKIIPPKPPGCKLVPV